MSNAYLYRMPSGIPGDVSRKLDSTVDTVFLDPANPFPSYGVPGKLVNGKFLPIAAGDTASVISGFLVRPYPTQSAQEPIGTATPPSTGVGNRLRRGWMTVKNNAGSPANGGAVYVRVGAAAAGKPIGGIEAAADGANTVVINGASFTNAGDADGNVEIEFNI